MSALDQFHQETRDFFDRYIYVIAGSIIIVIALYFNMIMNFKENQLMLLEFKKTQNEVEEDEGSCYIYEMPIMNNENGILYEIKK